MRIFPSLPRSTPPELFLKIGKCFARFSNLADFSAAHLKSTAQGDPPRIPRFTTAQCDPHRIPRSSSSSKSRSTHLQLSSATAPGPGPPIPIPDQLQLQPSDRLQLQNARSSSSQPHRYQFVTKLSYKIGRDCAPAILIILLKMDKWHADIF